MPRRGGRHPGSSAIAPACAAWPACSPAAWAAMSAAPASAAISSSGSSATSSTVAWPRSPFMSAARSGRSSERGRAVARRGASGSAPRPGHRRPPTERRAGQAGAIPPDAIGRRRRLVSHGRSPGRRRARRRSRPTPRSPRARAARAPRATPRRGGAARSALPRLTGRGPQRDHAGSVAGIVLQGYTRAKCAKSVHPFTTRRSGVASARSVPIRTVTRELPSSRVLGNGHGTPGSGV